MTILSSKGSFLEHVIVRRWVTLMKRSQRAVMTKNMQFEKGKLMVFWELMKGELVKRGHEKKACLVPEPRCTGLPDLNQDTLERAVWVRKGCGQTIGMFRARHERNTENWEYQTKQYGQGPERKRKCSKKREGWGQTSQMGLWGPW